MLRRIHFIAISTVTLIALFGAASYSSHSSKKAEVEAVRALATKGDVASQYAMALRYETGDGVRPSAPLVLLSHEI
jgi:hypothetical protein